MKGELDRCERSPAKPPYRLLSVLVCMTLLLAACKESINSKVSEDEANDALSVLLNAGIDAVKAPADETSYDIQVDKDDIARALDVLHSHGLPHNHYQNLGQIFKKDGLVATPAEERVRYVYGVSQELEQTLSRIDGVVVARVHVVIPQNDPLADAKTPSSASVFIKYRPSADPNALAPVVRNLVVRGIEGLDPDHVSVAFVVAEPPPAAVNRLQMAHLLGVRIDAKSVPWFAILLGLPWALVVIVLIAIATRYRSGFRRECKSVSRWVAGVWHALRGKRPTLPTETADGTLAATTNASGVVGAPTASMPASGATASQGVAS